MVAATSDKKPFRSNSPYVSSFSRPGKGCFTTDSESACRANACLEDSLPRPECTTSATISALTLDMAGDVERRPLAIEGCPL